MELLTAGASQLGLWLRDSQIDQFETFFRELTEWNQRANLTAITGYHDVQVKHFLDSLTVCLAADGLGVTLTGYVAALSNGATVTGGSPFVSLNPSTLTTAGLLHLTNQTTVPGGPLASLGAGSALIAMDALVRVEASGDFTTTPVTFTGDFTSFLTSTSAELAQITANGGVLAVDDSAVAITGNLVTLTAPETGHLVLSTLHAPAVAEAIPRIITAFPPEAQASIRGKLAQNLHAVVAQRLLPRKEGEGRIVACEVMTASARARELILDPLKVKELADLIKKGTVAEGMLSFDQSLFDLYKRGLIDDETALQHATSATDLKLKLDGY